MYTYLISERGGSVLSPKYVLKRLGLQNAALLISSLDTALQYPTLAEIAKYRPKIKKPLYDLWDLIYVISYTNEGNFQVTDCKPI